MFGKGFCSVSIILAASCITAIGQIAAGGSYTLEQSVIANGGGAGSDGGVRFSLIGTSGEAIAGNNSTASPYSIRGGFWQSLLGATAAGVSISGRVLRFDMVPVRKASVTITDSSGQTWVALSSPLGYYRFYDIPAGETYIISVSSKTYQFVPRVVTVLDELTDLDLVAMP